MRRRGYDGPMKTSVEVPLANKAGKMARLELDHETGEVRMIYTSLGDPRMHLDHLERAVTELRAQASAASSAALLQ